MNIYNFIYCFFYNLWEKKGSDGRINGTGVVFFSLLIHILLILEIVYNITGYRISLLPSSHGATYGQRKGVNFIICIPFIIAIWLFYNRTRTDRILKQYEKLFDRKEKEQKTRIILYIIIPLISVLILAILRQKGLI
jgi:amino acid permease